MVSYTLFHSITKNPMREILIISQCGCQETDLDSNTPELEKGTPGVGERRKGAFCLAMGGLRVQYKGADQKRGGKGKQRKQLRQRPGDKRVWKMQELNEAGALGEQRKGERERGSLAR